MDKINLDKYMESFNKAFIFPPANYWLGTKILKTPFDLMVLQEIIFDKKPDMIIECGTLYRGSAYFMACLMDLIGIDGKIITIDHEVHETQAHTKTDFVKIDGKITRIDNDVYQAPINPKIQFIHSDCLTATLPKLGARTMVILDCNHSTSHVYRELERFSDMVSIGQYLIVEDTDAYQEEGGGPVNAVAKFLKNNNNFTIDQSREKYGISSNLGGYLLRIS